MLKDPNLIQAGTGEPANGSKSEIPSFDTRVQFEVWLDELRPVLPLQLDHDPPDFIVECDSGSNCEILFEGALYLKGFLGGDIRSDGGTLITGPGIINGNIEVGTAIIGSFGRVNVTASERVLLRGKVIVEGNIYSNSLSIREGTFFDGNCCFLEGLEPIPETSHLQTGEAAPVILAVSAATDQREIAGTQD